MSYYNIQYLSQELKNELPKIYYIRYFFFNVPGPGQVYNGQWKKGLAIFITIIILYYLTSPFISAGILNDPLQKYGRNGSIFKET